MFLIRDILLTEFPTFLCVIHDLAMKSRDFLIFERKLITLISAEGYNLSIFDNVKPYFPKIFPIRSLVIPRNTRDLNERGDLKSTQKSKNEKFRIIFGRNLEWIQRLLVFVDGFELLLLVA